MMAQRRRSFWSIADAAATGASERLVADSRDETYVFSEDILSCFRCGDVVPTNVGRDVSIRLLQDEARRPTRPGQSDALTGLRDPERRQWANHDAAADIIGRQRVSTRIGHFAINRIISKRDGHVAGR